MTGYYYAGIFVEGGEQNVSALSDFLCYPDYSDVAERELTIIREVYRLTISAEKTNSVLDRYFTVRLKYWKNLVSSEVKAFKLAIEDTRALKCVPGSGKYLLDSDEKRRFIKTKMRRIALIEQLMFNA